MSKAFRRKKSRFLGITRRVSRPLAFSLVIGVLAGSAAALLEWGLDVGVHLLIGRVTENTLSQLGHFHWGVLVLPVLGGLFSGLIVLWLCPDSKGHGTDALTRAFHRKHGDMPLRGPAVKAAASVVVISSGGSAGPEGPIAALGAALGSTLGRRFHLTPRERRILLIAGCAAGVGAIFRCPLGGALFAVSILYTEPEYESEAMMPAVVASVIGYSLFMAIWGAGEPLLREARHLKFSSPIELLPYALLGPLCGVVSIFFSICFSFVEHRLANAPWMPRWLSPAVGGLVTGGIACLVPAVMDSRYQLIQGATDGSLFAGSGDFSWWGWAGIFGAFVVAKCLATSFTVGSGGSGGVLGPSLFLGGAVGAFLGAVLAALLPGAIAEPLRQALIPVGMGGVLAASMRTPIAAIVMVTEMTGSYQLIVPLMLVCSTAYLVGRKWGLNKEQVPTSAESPVHAADAMIHLLESWRVRDFVQKQWDYVVTPTASLGEILGKIEPGTHPIFAVVEDERLRGLITLPDIDRIHDPLLQKTVIAEDMMTERLTVLWPDDDLYEALEFFRRENYDVLPVIAEEPPHRWQGMLTRNSVFKALSAQIETSRQFILEEYAGLIAMDQEAELDNLLLAVSPRQGARMERLMVPIQALGSSIRECDFRNTFGIQIIAVELPDGTVESPPDINRPLEGSHRLLAIVTPDARRRPPAARESG